MVCLRDFGWRYAALHVVIPGVEVAGIRCPKKNPDRMGRDLLYFIGRVDQKREATLFQSTTFQKALRYSARRFWYLR